MLWGKHSQRLLTVRSFRKRRWLLCFSRDLPTMRSLNYRNPNLPIWRVLANHPICPPMDWYAKRPAEFESEPKDLNIAPMAQYSAFTGIGSLSWIANYIYGLLIAGPVGQSRTFPRTGKPDNPRPLPSAALLGSVVGRIKSRTCRPPKHSDVIRKGSRGMVELGRLAGPALLNEFGRVGDIPSNPLSNTFRFDVVQGEKARPCDDMRGPLTNRTFSLVSSISYPSWGDVAQSSSYLVTTRRSVALGVDDESDTYKKQPRRRADGARAVAISRGAVW